MSDKPRNPKLDLEVNVPAVITIGKKFWQGSNDYGKSYGYNVTYEGSEYTFFASEFVHERFQSFGQGTTVKITKRQPAGEKGIRWDIGELNGHAPAQNKTTASNAPQRELKYEPSTFDRDAYREQRVERLREAFQDAALVRDSLLASDLNIDLAAEDLRSIAISFVIEEQRERVPLKPAEKPPDANIPALLEDIKKTLTDYIPDQSEIAQQSKSELLEHAFGVKGWQPVTQMDGQTLIEGLAKLKAKIQEEQDDLPF